MTYFYRTGGGGAWPPWPPGPATVNQAELSVQWNLIGLGDPAHGRVIKIVRKTIPWGGWSHGVIWSVSGGPRDCECLVEVVRAYRLGIYGVGTV